jgi:hypothetical protein
MSAGKYARMMRRRGGAPSGLLTLEFDNIANAPVADPSDVSDWNTFFILPTLGTAFSSVAVTGNVVTLFNSGTILLKNEIFNIGANPRTWLVRFIDSDIITDLETPSSSRRHFLGHAGLIDVQMPVIKTIGAETFRDCTGLVSVFFPEVTSLRRTTSGSPFTACTSLVYADFPKCLSIEDGSFQQCSSLAAVNFPVATQISSFAFFNTPSLAAAHFPEVLQIGSQCFLLSVNNATMTSFSAPKCTNILGTDVFRRRTGLTTINLADCIQLGSTTANNNCFAGISGNTITFHLPVGTRTDGDAVAIAAANTVTFLP